MLKATPNVFFKGGCKRRSGDSQWPAVAEGPLTLKFILLLGVLGGGRGEVVAPHVVVLEGMDG